MWQQFRNGTRQRKVEILNELRSLASLAGRKGFPMYYNEYIHYNILLGCSASRVSIADAHGREHFRIIPHTRTYAEDRVKVLRELEREVLGHADETQV